MVGEVGRGGSQVNKFEQVTYHVTHVSVISLYVLDAIADELERRIYSEQNDATRTGLLACGHLI